MFVLGVVIVHLRYASRFIIPFPHLVLAIAILQYVLGAWLSYYHPSEFPLYNIGPFMQQYLGYATGVVIASAIASRPDAGPSRSATGVRSPIDMASPAWVV